MSLYCSLGTFWSNSINATAGKTCPIVRMYGFFLRLNPCVERANPSVGLFSVSDVDRR